MPLPAPIANATAFSLDGPSPSLEAPTAHSLPDARHSVEDLQGRQSVPTTTGITGYNSVFSPGADSYYGGSGGEYL
jgi:hypothetical protein